jgi:hypothetical protein
MRKHNAMRPPLILPLIPGPIIPLIPNMNIDNGMMKQLVKLGLMLMIGVSMSAYAELFGFGGTSWKEEALLHDGRKIIVERSQTRGGRHEIGQEVPINSLKISFTLPESHKAITWDTTIGMNDSDSSLKPLALDVVKGVPYLVTVPLICHNYNKWGRPNPPYVYLKYDGKGWQRIPLEEFPTEIKAANLVNRIQAQEHQLASHTGVVTADEIKQFNGTFKRNVLYQQIFVREKIKNAAEAPVLDCPEFE